MTKEEALQAIQMLSALESWAMCQKAQPPDYLYEDLHIALEVLTRIVLDKNKTQEKYVYGTPLMDAMKEKI
jgi:hypothetical protein